MPNSDEKVKSESSSHHDSIVDSTLHPKHYGAHGDQRNLSFFSQPKLRSYFISQLLLYEHLIIPTNDFGVVPSLITWMGADAFEEALDCRSIRFLRRKGVLGYLGNGNGINEFKIADTPQKPFSWWDKAFWGELPEAVELQLVYGQPGLTSKHRNRLIEKTIKESNSVGYENESFVENIAKGTYADIRDTPQLKAFLVELAMSAGIKPGTPLNMAWLPGVTSNSMQVAIEGPIQNPIDFVIKVGEANMEIFLAESVGGADFHASRGAELLLQSKLLHAGFPSAKVEGFVQLLTVNGIPDIRPAIESGSVSVPELWKVRQGRKARHFREWLTTIDAKTTSDFVRRYVESLGETSLMESVPARMIRFGITTALGLMNPLLGGGLGLTDTLFTEKYIRGYRPKLMFSELAKLFPAA